jgi:hypothetical protein
MTGTTTTEGYPYPLTSDFADVQDAYRLAIAIDADLRAEQAPFRAFVSRPAFIAQQAANGSGFTSGSDLLKASTIVFDNTGGLVLNATSWTQPISQGPSWWMFGATLFTTPISGTPVVGDLNEARIRVNTTDQVSNVVTTSNFYQRNDETNTGSESINIHTMAQLYRGTVSLALILNGSSSKAIAGGSVLWGLYLGPVT